jgi:hypothetical protein
MVLASGRYDTGTKPFPFRLLALGYATGALAALNVYRQFGGFLAPVLTFWLGGAIATLAWGGLWFCILQRRATGGDRAVSSGLSAGPSVNTRMRTHVVRLREPSGAAPSSAPLRQ